MKMKNDFLIDIKKDIFSSFSKKEDTVVLSFLVDYSLDDKEDDLEYLSTKLIEIAFYKVKNLNIEGKEADNYFYNEGYIDTNKKIVFLKYKTINFIKDESSDFFSFSFEYKEYKKINEMKVSSPDC